MEEEEKEEEEEVEEEEKEEEEEEWIHYKPMTSTTCTYIIYYGTLQKRLQIIHEGFAKG